MNWTARFGGGWLGTTQDGGGGEEPRVTLVVRTLAESGAAVDGAVTTPPGRSGLAPLVATSVVFDGTDTSPGIGDRRVDETALGEVQTVVMTAWGSLPRMPNDGLVEAEL